MLHSIGVTSVRHGLRLQRSNYVGRSSESMEAISKRISERSVCDLHSLKCPVISKRFGRMFRTSLYIRSVSPGENSNFATFPWAWALDAYSITHLCIMFF